MTFQLGGWWRLWVVSSVLWASVVSFFAFSELPKPEKIPHSAEFLKKLSNEALLILAGEAQPKVSAKSPAWKHAPFLVEMPNGFNLEFQTNTTDEQANLVAREYFSLLEAEARYKKNNHLLKAFLIWLVPSIVVLSLGIAAAWVLSGFRKSKNSVRPLMKYVVDTNIINRLVDGTIGTEELPMNGTFVASHIQIKEINRTKNPERRKKLLEKFAETVQEILPTESFVLGVSQLDGAKLGGGEGYKLLKAELDARNGNKPNNSHDALIAEIAMNNGYVLLTADFDLYQVAYANGIGTTYWTPA